MEESPVAIHVDHVSKRYGKGSHLRTALNDISFDIPLGQTWCLLGPNGSGKTTLLKILAGLLTPTEGSVSLMGIDGIKRPMETRKKVGWMPAEERGGFYGRLTAKENLRFFGALQGVDLKEIDRRIGNAAFVLDFNEELDEMFLKASAGARQKFGLARLILHEPSILLLDEPMRNLDPHAVLRFRRLIKDHLTRREKKTVLMSTHQLEEAHRIADHILIIHEGQIIHSVSARDLEVELKHKSVEEFYLKIIDRTERE